MSGASRASMKMRGSMFFASAWAAAFFRIAERLPRVRRKVGIEAW